MNTSALIKCISRHDMLIHFMDRYNLTGLKDATEEQLTEYIKEILEMKKTVVFDFDGVIHSYTSGWKGETVIPDPPVPGIAESIKAIHDAGYEVVIVSTRCATDEGMTAVKRWLDKYHVMVDAVMKEKPPAIVYIDDRAICFNGNPSTLLWQIQNFKPWYQKEPEDYRTHILGSFKQEPFPYLKEDKDANNRNI